MKIKLYTSMIFDAICACTLINIYKNYDHIHSVQKEVLEILKERMGEIIIKDNPGYSIMCGIVASYIPDPSSATLDDLYSMFDSISEVDNIVRPKIKNEFKQSYIFPALDMLKNGAAEKYCECITALKEAGFEELWRTKILPVEKEQIKKLENSFGATDIDSILQTISNLKRTNPDTVTTYISLLSFPVSFTLDENSFLDTINGGEYYYKYGFLSMIAHELMHGFASKELPEIYLNFVNESCYLRTTHDFLIHNMNSGDEEEFVMAAEYYIMWRSGIMTKEQIVRQNAYRYGGSVPLAFYVFEHMTREDEPIIDYNRWLINCFSNGTFLSKDIIPTINALLPPPDNFNNFFVNLFVILQRCSYIIKDAQLNYCGDIKEQIENLLNAKFISNDDKTVSFADGSKELESYLKRETLVLENLNIDRIEFHNKKDALSFRFSCSGANIGVPVIVYEGEQFSNSFCLNMAYHKDKSNRAEISFVCGNTKYLITSACPDGVIDLDCEEDQDITYRTYGKEMIDAVKLAESIVMLLY